jgi:hypothetical protein
MGINRMGKSMTNLALITAAPKEMKSIQHGRTGLTRFLTYIDVTISAVNTSKTEVHYLGTLTTITASDGGGTMYFAGVYLLDSTHIRIVRGETNSSVLKDVYVSWEVIEWN